MCTCTFIHCVICTVLKFLILRHFHIFRLFISWVDTTELQIKTSGKQSLISWVLVKAVQALWISLNKHTRSKSSCSLSLSLPPLSPPLSLSEVCPPACHEGTWGYEAYLHLLLISALEGCEWVVSGMLCPGGRALGTHLIGGLMGPRASVNALEKWEMCCFCHKLNCDFLVI